MPPPTIACGGKGLQNHHHDGASVCTACSAAFLFRAHRIDRMRGAFLEIPGGIGGEDQTSSSPRHSGSFLKSHVRSHPTLAAASDDDDGQRIYRPALLKEHGGQR